MASSPATLSGPAASGPAARLWRRLKAWLQPPPIATVDALRTFLAERAALISQKCAIDYVRGKTGLVSHALFTEKTFLDALDVCRWETYVVVLGDLLLVAEGHLRPQLPSEEHARLREALIALYTASIGALPLPAHREQGWQDVLDTFASRIETAGGGAPRRARDIADHSAARLFETLPIHARYRELDEEVIYGAVRFRMVAVSQEMERRFAATELAGRLIAQGHPREGTEPVTP